MLDRLSPNPGARRRRKRVGRGAGSGKGKTCGRGTKGQGHRSAGRPKGAGFEGGQMPLARRLPKRGFHNLFRKDVEIVNLADLARLGENAEVSVEALVAHGLVRGKGVAIKLLGEGEAPKGLSVKVHRVSASARKKVEEAGGSVELLS